MADIDPVERAYLAMHDASMSDDDLQACYGRMLKIMWPAFIEATGAEEDRSTHRGIIAFALVRVCASIVGCQVQSSCKQECERPALEGSAVEFRTFLLSPLEAKQK